MRLEDLDARNLPALLSVDEARSYGLIRSGRRRAYEDVRAGIYPSIRSGNRIWIPTARLLDQLGLGEQSSETASPPGHHSGGLKADTYATDVPSPKKDFDHAQISGY